MSIIHYYSVDPKATINRAEGSLFSTLKTGLGVQQFCFEAEETPRSAHPPPGGGGEGGVPPPVLLLSKTI